MTANDLIAAFDAIADAPHGARRLRELVLQLAVRGKLVAQKPDEEPGDSLLRRIGTELAERGGRSRAARRSEAPATIGIERFTLPRHWAWGTADSCTEYIRRGKSPFYDDDQGRTPVVSQKCVQWSGFDISRARFVGDASVEKYAPEQFLRPGDLLWNSTGLGTLGRIIPFVASPNHARVVADSHVTIVRPYLCSSRYLWCWFAGPVVQAVINDVAIGTTKQTELSTKSIESFPVPIPPLAEQDRIVARVNELMELLDRLEAARLASDEVRRAARDAALSALRDAEDTDAVEAAWRRIAGKMEELFIDGEEVVLLRRAVLGLAIRGRLGPQDEGQVDVGLDAVAGPFPLPKLWNWERMADVAASFDYGTSSKSEPSGKVPVLRMGNLQRMNIDWSDLKYTSNEDEISKYMLEPETLLFNRTNSPALVGKTSLYRGERPAIFAGYLIRVVFGSRVLPAFANLVMNSDYAREWCWSVKADGVSQSNISASKLAELAMPVPPLAEQHRIVAKVDDLMAICDDLETRLSVARDLHGQFAAAAVHHLDV